MKMRMRRRRNKVEGYSSISCHSINWLMTFSFLSTLQHTQCENIGLSSSSPFLRDLSLFTFTLCPTRSVQLPNFNWYNRQSFIFKIENFELILPTIILLRPHSLFMVGNQKQHDDYYQTNLLNLISNFYSFI